MAQKVKFLCIKLSPHDTHSEGESSPVSYPLTATRVHTHRCTHPQNKINTYRHTHFWGEMGPHEALFLEQGQWADPAGGCLQHPGMKVKIQNLDSEHKLAHPGEAWPRDTASLRVDKSVLRGS